MDENGMIDEYANAKEIALICYQEDRTPYSPFGEFLSDCLEKGIDPSLELIRIEESIPPPVQQRQEPKSYQINNEVKNKLPSDLSKDVICGIKRIRTKIQPLVLSGSPFIRSMDQLIQSYVNNPSEGTIEFKLDNGFQRLLCHSIADYYCLLSYSTGDGSFRVTRVKSHSINYDIPTIPLSDLHSMFIQ